MVECTIQQKALVLLALIIEDLNASRSSKEEIGNDVAVFTASLDSTHRLARLLQLLWASTGFGPANEVAEFSSQLNQKERSSLVRQCSQGEIKVVVCSDGMARGMDIPAIVSVINYDIPGFAKTYVHRCGRTARAGRQGKATSILQAGGRDVASFRKFRKLIHNFDQVKPRGIRKDLAKDAVHQYPKCVQKLQDVIEMNPIALLGDDWFIDEDEESKASKSDSESESGDSELEGSGSDDDMESDVEMSE